MSVDGAAEEPKKTILRDSVRTLKREFSWTTLNSLEGTGLFRRLRKIFVERNNLTEDLVQFVCDDAEVLYEKNKFGGYFIKEILLKWKYHPLLHTGLESLSENLTTYIHFNDGQIDGPESLKVWCGDVLVLKVDHKKGVVL